MTVTLNGQSRDFTGILTLKEIIKQSCRNSALIIAEVNGDIVRNSGWEKTVINDGDTIELVSFVGGG